MTTVSMMMRCSELEQECAKIKHENQQMREIMAGMSDTSETTSPATLLAQQCAALQLDLDRTREEKTHLKTIVLGQESTMGTKESSGDSEVISAFKMIVKQLERELDAEKESSSQLRNEINSLKRDNDRQQQLIGLSSGITSGGNSSEDVVTRINQENIVSSLNLYFVVFHN